MELTDHHRWIYHDPSIGGDDPGTGFDDYLATPERIASWVAELAGSVVGLTGVFKPGRTSRRNRSSLPAGAVRKSANSSSEESFRKPARGYEYLAIRQPAARNISTIRECYDAGFRTRPGFRLRHDAERQLVEAGRRSWMRLHGAELDVLRVSSCVAPLRGPASILGRENVDSASGPACAVLRWCGRRVGGLGPGLTSDSADAARAVLRDDLSAGPRFLRHLLAVPV